MEPIGAGAPTLMDDCHARIRMQAQLIGLWLRQAYFQNRLRHGQDLSHSPQHGLKRIAAGPCDRGAQALCDVCCRHRRAVRPCRAADAENVTQAIVGDHPAFGKCRFNFTLCIKLHKALHQRPRHGQRRGVKGLAVGVSCAGFAADHTQRDCALIAIRTSADEQEKGEEREERPNHHPIDSVPKCLRHCFGADGGTRTRTSRGKQILSLLRLPVSPRPHAARIGESRAGVKGKADVARA